MGNPVLRYIGLILLSAFLGACNLGKWVPEGEYRLDENEITVDGKDAPSEVNNIVKQKPAPQLGNWVYTWGNPTDSSGFSRWVSDQGTPPTIFSVPLTNRTSTQLGYYYFNKGYFLNKTSYELEIDTPKKAVDVHYNVQLGSQYTIGKLQYEISSPLIEELVLKDSANSLIHIGDPYSEKQFQKERDRLAHLFRNDGFFGFSSEWIRFRADTTLGDHSVLLTLRILDRPVRLIDTTYTVPHERFYIENIYVDYGFNYLDPNANYSDTIPYNGSEFLIRDEETYHPHLVTRAIHFSPGEQFNAEVIKDSYSHLSSLGVFGATEIEFSGASDTNDHALTAFIKLTPRAKRTLTTQIEGTNTSGQYGISGNIGWLNRNLFGAGEILDLSLLGGIQAQFNTRENSGLFNTYEIGAEAGLTFSRFLIPVSWQEQFPKKWRPSTRLYTSLSQQTRVEFQRRIFKLGASFQAQLSEDWRAQVFIPEFNYVNLIDFDTSYVNSLFFKTGFQDVFISSIRFVFTYAPLSETNWVNRNFARFSFETSGNLLSTMDNNFQVDPETGQKKIFDVPYAQYLRADIDYRHYLKTSPNTRLVARVFAGVTYNYGNSRFLPPFEKNYLAGGSQDIRGWIAYRLGPGELPNTIYDEQNYAAVAPIKLMVNLEYRFPIAGSLQGALFTDAGNVWLFSRDYRPEDFEGLTEAQIESAKFNWNTVFRSSALGTGFGLRYDFGFFQLRLDGGVKVWDPSEPMGYQFVLDGLRWQTVTYNFALNYPF
ncbi:MAG: hypothetical protein HWE14_05980 [Flavobacteriia bacterium]|nr:hypothetical protein [Flavobacteriia bacterium]